jgi:hypothetical protein
MSPKKFNIKKLNYTNIICIVIVVVVCIVLFNRYNDLQSKKKRSSQSILENNENDYKAIQKYLLLDYDPTLAKTKKPILWIPIQYEYNSRNWASFGSRSSFELNQPYIYLTVKSILIHCSESFHICMIDDQSFSKLIPGWKIQMSSLSSPVSSCIRKLGLAKILSIYGGMIVPPSFVCLRDLIGMYNMGLNNNDMFVCETIDRNITSTTHDFYPNSNFMGAKKGANIVEEFIDFIQRTISSDYTSQSTFLGDFNRWCNSKIDKNYITIIPSKMVGVSTMDGSQVPIDDLLGNDYIDFYKNMYGIYIPSDEVLNRIHYQWFARLSPIQVLESNTILGKYILLANRPQSRGIVEPMKQRKTNNWVGYWQVPSGFGLWGMKPQPFATNLTRTNTIPKP